MPYAPQPSNVSASQEEWYEYMSGKFIFPLVSSAGNLLKWSPYDKDFIQNYTPCSFLVRGFQWN